MVFGAVGATSGGGDAAVEDYFEISTPRTGWIGAAVLCFGMGTSTEGTYGGVVAAGFDVAKSPAVITLFGGGRGVGYRADKVATEDRDSGEVSKGFPIFRRNRNHDRDGFLVVETGAPIWIEEACFGDKNGLGIKNRGLEGVTHGSVSLRVSLDGQAMNREL